MRRRRLLRRLAAAWAVAALLLLVFAGFAAVSGRAALQRARQQTAVGDLASGRPRTALRHAARDLTRAHDLLGSPVLWPIRIVPGVERQWRTARDLSGAGAIIARSTETAASHAQGLLSDQEAAGAGPARAALLRRAGAAAAALRTDLDTVHLGPRGWLVPPLAGARNRAGADLAEARVTLARAKTASDQGARFLDGPGHWLVLAANNAEMRSGSGTFLSVGVIEVADGHLHLDRFQSVTEVPVPVGAVPLEGDLRDRWEFLHPNREWRNLMVSPRFGVSAALAARMWAATGHPPVDGVIAVDLVGLRAALAATGPQQMGPGYTARADQILEDLMLRQYAFAERIGADDQARRDGLAAVASAVFGGVEAGGYRLSALADELAAASRGRHLLAWSADDAAEAGWTAAGIDGTVPGNGLMLGILNRGGNKLDQFLVTRAHVAVGSPRRSANSGSGSRASAVEREVTVTVDLENTTPDGAPGYVTGPPPDLAYVRGTYVGIATLTLPGDATAGSIDGADRLAVIGPDGPTGVIGVEVSLPQGAAQKIVFRFRLAGATGGLVVLPSARVPGVGWSVSGTSDDSSWTDQTSHSLTW